MKTIGVLALQGNFAEHIDMLTHLSAECIEIRQKKDLDHPYLGGLVLPGGESTVIGKLLHQTELYAPIKKMIENGMPVFGTCAGMILLAEKLKNDNSTHLATMPVTVKRNAYGRQLGSFLTTGDMKHIGKIPMTFIRAPYIEKSSQEVEILAVINQKAVAARYKNQLATAFHPELTQDYSVHEYFLNMANNH